VSPALKDKVAIITGGEKSIEVGRCVEVRGRRVRKYLFRHQFLPGLKAQLKKSKPGVARPQHWSGYIDESAVQKMADRVVETYGRRIS